MFIKDPPPRREQLQHHPDRHLPPTDPKNTHKCAVCMNMHERDEFKRDQMHHSDLCSSYMTIENEEEEKQLYLVSHINKLMLLFSTLHVSSHLLISPFEKVGY